MNWLDQIFRWKRDVEPMPGWELTQGWMSDEGMPDRGILNINYYLLNNYQNIIFIVIMLIF